MKYYKKTPDWGFRRNATKFGSEEWDDMRVQKGNDWKNIGKHRRMLDYIIQVQDVTNKEMNEAPTGVSRS